MTDNSNKWGISIIQSQSHLNMMFYCLCFCDVCSETKNLCLTRSGGTVGWKTNRGHTVIICTCVSISSCSDVPVIYPDVSMNSQTPQRALQNVNSWLRAWNENRMLFLHSSRIPLVQERTGRGKETKEKQEHVCCSHRELIWAGWRIEIATLITLLS